jgi:hypothetical protein
MLNPQVQGVLLEDGDVHVDVPDEAIENYCLPQKRHCGDFGIGLSGADNIQEHRSKEKIMRKDKERVKARPLRSSFRGCRGVSVGVAIGVRFNIFRRRRTQWKGMKSKIRGIF